MDIAICDDEEAIRTLLKSKLHSSFPFDNIQSFSDAKELLCLRKLPDILLLDIALNGISGLKAAEILRKRDNGFVLIFITGTKDYVFDAFDFGAFHYLVKPFTDEKLLSVMERAKNHLLNLKKEPERYIMISHNGLHTKLDLAEIIFAEVLNAKVTIHTLNRDIEYYGKLKNLEKLLGNGFFRTHRSYLVNLSHVRGYDANAVYLKKGTALMSKRNYPDFKQKLMSHNRDMVLFV